MSKTRIMFFVTMAAMLLSTPKVSAQNSDFIMFDWIEEDQDFSMFDWIEEDQDFFMFDWIEEEQSFFMFDWIEKNQDLFMFDRINDGFEGGYTLFNQQFGSDDNDNGGYELYNQIFGQDANLDVPLGSGLLILAAAGAGYALKKRKSNLKW